MNEAIVISDLEVTRGSRHVLKGVSTSLEKGSITGLLGPSGSGKSALIWPTAGVQRVKLRTAAVLGGPAGSFVAHASPNYMTQVSAAYKNLTVHENATHWARIARVPASTADEMVSQLRLTDCAHALAADISGSQALRLSLACMMIDGPPVLLFDEPAVGLDPVLHKKIQNLIHERTAVDITMLASSHVTDGAQRYNSLVFIREDNILVTGTADDILEETATSSMDAAFLALAKEQAE